MIGFFLKKIVSFLVQPFGLIITIFIIGLYFLFTKRNMLAKIFLSLSLSLLLLFSYPPFANLLVLPLETKYSKYNYNNKIRYIHVLGGGFNSDFSQPISSNLMEASLKRVIEGIIIYKQIKDSKIIFTGYKGGKDIPGSIMNAKLAIALGVKKEDIIVSTKEKDTKEEAIFTKTLLSVGEEFILVTSATHLSRAMFLFKSEGLNPIPAPTNFKKHKINSYFVMPNIETLKISQMAVHEYIGILWAKLIK